MSRLELKLPACCLLFRFWFRVWDWGVQTAYQPAARLLPAGCPAGAPSPPCPAAELLGMHLLPPHTPTPPACLQVSRLPWLPRQIVRRPCTLPLPARLLHSHHACFCCSASCETHRPSTLPMRTHTCTLPGCTSAPPNLHPSCLPSMPLTLPPGPRLPSPTHPPIQARHRALPRLAERSSGLVGSRQLQVRLHHPQP